MVLFRQRPLYSAFSFLQRSIFEIGDFRFKIETIFNQQSKIPSLHQSPPFLKGDSGGFYLKAAKLLLPYDKKLKARARELRKNMTEAESFLWQRIRRKQLKGRQFYRQKNIGNYIVDFYCPSARVIVELDGGQHYTQEGIRRDQVRDKSLESLGFTILRFSDREVFKNIEGVLERIFEHL